MKRWNATMLGVALGMAPALAGAQAFTEKGAELLGETAYNLRSTSFGDIDGDGDPDLLLQGTTSSRKLFRNEFMETGTASFTAIGAPHGHVASDTAGCSDAGGD